MAAGVALQRMRRRVRLSRLALFTAVAAGPVALGVTVMSGPATVAAAPTAKPTTVRTAAGAADPAGYAQLFLSAWLRASADDATRAQARLAQVLAPGVDLPETAGAAQVRLDSVTAVRSAQRGGGRWAVTVAAQYADAAVRYFVVPVATDHAGGSFTVTGAPGVVAGPARAAVAKSPYGVAVPSGSDLASAVGEFLGVYLTGGGEVDRYLAPRGEAGVGLPRLLRRGHRPAGDGQYAAGAETGGQPKAVGWEKALWQRRVALPADSWSAGRSGAGRRAVDVPGWQQDQVAAATKAELSRLAGLLERRMARRGCWPAGWRRLAARP
ncbi:conjugal transfer protein [Streptomyces sp. NRRL S-813]|uniref:conjugal transfer protein n=1 Tax=Streptomyces sp. NRRL S-813 TaxID=1463919 RepID=UPI002D21E749|nr:conjugal transfer protein [Streptomyces sp. NRRL S-813]